MVRDSGRATGDAYGVSAISLGVSGSRQLPGNCVMICDDLWDYCGDGPAGSALTAPPWLPLDGRARVLGRQSNWVLLLGPWVAGLRAGFCLTSRKNR